MEGRDGENEERGERSHPLSEWGERHSRWFESQSTREESVGDMIDL
jgi:hypothetical protein